MKSQFTWVPFYEELADKLLQYKSNRSELVEKVKRAHKIGTVDLPRIEADNNYVPDIDPFTVFALFNRGKQRMKTRQNICEGYKQVFSMTSNVPSDFDGIPVYFYNQYCFYRFFNDPRRDNQCFDYLWSLFEQALIYSKEQLNTKGFIDAFEKVMSLSLVGLSKMTIGLFHIRPNTFVNLDSKNGEVIANELQESAKGLSGTEYLSLCSQVLKYSKEKLNGSFPEFSYYAYLTSVKTDSEKWEPTLEEYDPQLTKDDWLRFMRESGKLSNNCKYLLAAMYDIGGQATCTQLEETYGKTASFFNRVATRFAELVHEYTKCPLWTDDNSGQKHLYSIPFLGRKATNEELGVFVWKLRTELKEAIEEYGLVDYLKTLTTKSAIMKEGKTMFPKNTILYGPPGTGKTYNSVIYAVAIIENKRIEEVCCEPYSEIIGRYNEYKANGQIEFTTFHQSYGYEEFIEGIRPVMDEDVENTSDMEYQITPGVFKTFCDIASLPVFKDNANLGLNSNPTIWKVSLERTGDNPTRTECMENNHIRIGWEQYGAVITDETEIASGKAVLNAFINRMKIGDIVFSCYSAKTIDAIGVVTGDYEWHDEYEHYKRLRNVKWLVKGINEDITSINSGKAMTLASTYSLNNITLSDALALIEKYTSKLKLEEAESKNYVFIIDEINRGNISKIFGELITLIEPSKRMGEMEGMRAKLPYSQKPFGVPNNVYILGTMNTADRSIATLDTALRRRFSFKEMLPDASMFDNIFVGKINIGTMLSNMNKKITVLYDREHTIGHAYFIPLMSEPTIENLANIFENKIIPLLQEYFYEDYEKIRLVLGDNKKDSKNHQFIIASSTDYYSLFGDSSVDFEDGITYEINTEAFYQEEAYKSI